MKFKLVVLCLLLSTLICYSQNPCSAVPNCNYQNNFQTSTPLYVNTDSVSNITDSSATLYGWATTMDACCNSGSYPMQVTAIAAWSTDCNPVCNSYLGGLDTATFVYNNTTWSAWVNNVNTSINLKNLKPNTTYYVRYMVCRSFYGNNFPPSMPYWAQGPTYCIGNILQFTTKAGLPVLNNNIITSDDQVICPSGNPATFVPASINATQPTGGNGSYTFFWQKKVDTLGRWENCSGGTLLSYTPSSFSDPHVPYFSVKYRRLIKSGKLIDTSNAVTITYLPGGYRPVVTVKQLDAGKASMLLGLEMHNSVQSYNVQWYDSLAGAAKTLIPGTNGNSLLIKLTTSSPMHIYNAEINFGSNCSLSKTKNIYISPPDGDGNYYPAVKIGNQIWMINNLRTTRLNNGVSIRKATKNTGNYYWYNNDSLSYAKKFGALYDTTVISTQSANVCPVGWKAAGIIDWFEMIDFIGGPKNAGLLLKSQSEWDISDYQSNAYNFNALPTGEGLSRKRYEGKGQMATWWSVIPTTQITGYIYNYAFVELIEADNNFYLVTPTKLNQNNTKHSIRCFTR